MHYLRNIFNILAVIAVLLLVSCSAHDNIIPRKDMERIIGEVYLADQYIERHPEFRAQTDTLILYEGVMQRNGYTLDDYTKSIEYYLQEGDALKKIHLNARKKILKHKEELSELVRQQNKQTVRWWASDSVARKEINSLWKEPYLRNLKWMANFQARHKWRFTDSTLFDSPQNPVWWQKTITSNSHKSPADSLYPILQRQYLIWKENNPHKAAALKAFEKAKKKKAEMDRRRKSRK